MNTDSTNLSSIVDVPAEHPFRWLLLAARRAFPDRHASLKLPAQYSPREVWTAVAAGAGVDTWTLARAVGAELGIEAAPELKTAETMVARLVPEMFARSVQVLPMQELQGKIVVATSNPFDDSVLARVRFVADRRVDARIAPPEDIEAAIPTLYSRAAEQQNARIGTLRWSSSGDAVSPSVIDNSPVVDLARKLLQGAIDRRASDLHLQPYLGGGMVRARIDGSLRRLAFLPNAVADALLRYFKAQGGMDPTNDRIPQDGRMGIVFGSRDFDLRLSVLPASRGERLVIRLLDQSRVYSLGAVGFSLSELQTMRRMMTSSAGVILMTGPTGSGKTSTLYSMLADLHRPDVAIVTVENPVEYRIPGISQVEVNTKAGLTFGAALRSILRQDPDIILIGEIRDDETAEIAMQSAMTGHLVLSTLHTNDALTAIPRLLDLGVAPSVVADGIIGVISQRLLRRLCAACRAPVRKPLTADEELFSELTGERPAFRAAGCPACEHSGYHGRFPVTEIVEMNTELAHAISTGKSGVADLAPFVSKQFKPMSINAANRVISGDTSAIEAAQVLGRRFWNELSQAYGRTPTQAAVGGVAATDAAVARTGVMLFTKDAAAAPGMVAALEDANLRVVTSNDAAEARALLEQNEDIVLLAIDLEAMDGADKFKHLIALRQSLTWAGLPVVVMVGEGDAEIRETLENFGISDYLVKPVEPGVLVSRVRAAFQR